MIKDWNLEIAFHLPHDRMAIGWDYIRPDDIDNYDTIKLYLIFVTLTLDFQI